MNNIKEKIKNLSKKIKDLSKFNCFEYSELNECEMGEVGKLYQLLYRNNVIKNKIKELEKVQ